MIKSFGRYWLPAEGRFHTDCLSGVTVALALIPEAIAFALIAHVSPLVGLYAAFFMCLITSVFGGRPGMISGATGATAVVMVSLVLQHGLSYLFATIMLTGLLQILIGWLRCAQFIRLMPKSVMVGFVNGLAIVILLAQLNQFKYLDSQGVSQWLQHDALWTMVILALLAMAITHYLPKLTRAVPSALTAIVVVSLVVFLGDIHTRVVADMLAKPMHFAAFPHIGLPEVPWHWHTLSIIFPYAAILALVGLAESLMTLMLIDERTHTRGQGNRECAAQGMGNLVSGLFGTMGGCAMIGQSMINISSGARGRLSGVVASLFLLAFVLLFWPWIQHIPLAALVGVMLMVVIETFEWASFHFIRHIPRHDALLIVVVTAVTVLTNLAIALIVGIVVASLVFAWQSAQRIHAEIDQVLEENETSYRIHGPLFFGSCDAFKALFHPETDLQFVVIDFQHSRVSDQSAISAIQSVAQRYAACGKALHLRHLSPECRKLLGRAGDLVHVNVQEDPDYRVATEVLE